MVLLCQNQDGDDQSTPRQGIEDKLMEEYRRSSYFTQTRQELGELLSFSGNWHYSNEFHLMSPFSERIRNDNVRKNTTPLRTITYNTSFLTQFRWVLKRTFLNLMLNPQTSIAQVFTSPSLSLQKRETKEDDMTTLLGRIQEKMHGTVVTINVNLILI